MTPRHAPQPEAPVRVDIPRRAHAAEPREIARVRWTSPTHEIIASVRTQHPIDAYAPRNVLRIRVLDHAGLAPSDTHPADGAEVQCTHAPDGRWLHLDAPGAFAASFLRDADRWTLVYARLSPSVPAKDAPEALVELRPDESHVLADPDVEWNANASSRAHKSQHR